MSTTKSSVSSCPRCHQIDSSQSASSVVTGGISTTAYGGSSTGLGYIQGQGLVVTRGSHSGTEVNQTELSSRLTLPNPPSYTSPYWWMLVLLFVPFCGAFFGSTALIINILIWIGLVIGLFMWCSNTAPKRKAAFDAAMVQYNRAKDRWKQLYYCHRDDIIYLPDGTYDHPNNMWNFLIRTQEQRERGKQLKQAAQPLLTSSSAVQPQSALKDVTSLQILQEQVSQQNEREQLLLSASLGFLPEPKQKEKSPAVAEPIEKGELQREEDYLSQLDEVITDPLKEAEMITIYCIHCGTQLPAIASFCLKCGKPVK